MLHSITEFSDICAHKYVREDISLLKKQTKNQQSQYSAADK